MDLNVSFLQTQVDRDGDEQRRNPQRFIACGIVVQVHKFDPEKRGHSKAILGTLIELLDLSSLGSVKNIPCDGYQGSNWRDGQEPAQHKPASAIPSHRRVVLSASGVDRCMRQGRCCYSGMVLRCSAFSAIRCSALQRCATAVAI